MAMGCAADPGPNVLLPYSVPGVQRPIGPQFVQVVIEPSEPPVCTPPGVMLKAGAPFPVVQS